MTNLQLILSGIECKANHPITCLNPAEWFTPNFIRTEERDGINIVWVRAESTCWFRLDQMEVRKSVVAWGSKDGRWIRDQDKSIRPDASEFTEPFYN